MQRKRKARTAQSRAKAANRAAKKISLRSPPAAVKSSAKPSMSKPSMSKRSRSQPSTSKSSKSPRERVRAYRKRMRMQGLRLVQMWLPDTRTAEFAALAHRASLAIANSPTEQQDQAFIDSVQWWTSQEADASA
jgi:hypothetical protein